MQNYLIKVAFTDGEIVSVSCFAPTFKMAEIRARAWAKSARDVPVKECQDLTSEFDSILQP